MSEVITGVVKFAFGFISNKLRTYGAEKLDDGGLTDQKLHGLIVREFDEIKSKLDAIARKDLGTSISSLQEGIISLIMSHGESLESGNPSSTKLPSAGACSVEAKPSLSSVTVEDAITLANVIREMKIESNDRLESAKESFKEACKEANRAFHNAALSTEERILAAKVRIASRILQHLDDLEFAVSKCLHCVRELNDMRAIQEIFSVDVKGGIKSVFKKDSRKEIVENVAMVNWVLADFISKFTKIRMTSFDWPLIQCGKQLVHPIYYYEKRLPNLKEMKIKPPWYIVGPENEIKIPSNPCVINKKGDLIGFTKNKPDLQKLDHTTGKLQPYCLSSLDGTTECPRLDKVIGLAVDEDDALYVLSGDQKDGYALSVYGADGKNTHHSFLEFLRGENFYSIKMNVNNDKNIVIGLNPIAKAVMVYLCNSNGKLIHSFDTGLNHYFIQFVSGSCKNEIVLLTKNIYGSLKGSNVLHMYTEDGQLQKTVKFRPSDGHDIYDSLFYNRISKNIIGCVRDIDNDRTLIEQLSGETSELQHSYLLCGINFPLRRYFCCLVGHPSGTLALFGNFHLILLKKPSQ